MKKQSAEPSRITLPPPAPEDEYVASAFTSAAVADADEHASQRRRTHSSGLRFAKVEATTSGIFPVAPRSASHADSALAPTSVRRADVEVQRFLAKGEPGRALMVAEHALAAGIGDPALLELHAAIARDALAASYRERLGGGDVCLRPTRPSDASDAAGLDPQLAFVLSLIDGRTTVDEVVDLSGLPLLDAVRAVSDLLREGLIERGAPRR